MILGMAWLCIYHANANYHTKVVSFRTLDGKEVKFKDERNEMCEGLVLTLTARKLVRKRGEVYLVYVIDKEWRNEIVKNPNSTRIFKSISRRLVWITSRTGGWSVNRSFFGYNPGITSSLKDSPNYVGRS